jgi:hypothetical protein
MHTINFDLYLGNSIFDTLMLHQLRDHGSKQEKKMVSEYSHNSALLQNGKGKGKKEFKD